jgi:hypothetical protein
VYFFGTKNVGWTKCEYAVPFFENVHLVSDLLVHFLLPAGPTKLMLCNPMHVASNQFPETRPHAPAISAGARACAVHQAVGRTSQESNL